MEQTSSPDSPFENLLLAKSNPGFAPDPESRSDDSLFSADSIHTIRPEPASTPGDRPLNKLLDDDNIRIMEYFIPYCDTSVSRFLAYMIKIRELNKIRNGFDEPQLRACGQDNNNQDIESLLRSLKHNVSSEMSAQIDSILQLLQFGRIYQKFNEITRDHPEILNMMSGDRMGAGTNDTGVFSDPSVFRLLNSMLNGHDPGNNDKMKNVLELAMKGNGESMDMTSLLASLMARQG